MQESIRLAGPEEAAAVADLVQRAYQPWVAIVGRRPAPMDDDYPAHVAAREVFVLPRDGRIAAVAVLIDAPDHLMLDNVAVDPDLAGTGLGRVMMDFSEAEARRRGYRDLRLFTNALMTRNIALYERLGFAETHRRQEGAFFRVFMSKPVG
ncbi:MAG: GNAT family N-acetyltransferase [Proteobacteria bacterium]|nr:GNAT family N-acetyltransferase [Pseudomonadota bacterium]